MVRAHRWLKFAHWFRDHIRLKKPSAKTSDSKNANTTDVETAGCTSERSEDIGHPRKSTENSGKPDVPVCRESFSETRIHTSTNEDQEQVKTHSLVAADLGAGKVVDEAGKHPAEEQATTAAENGLEPALPMSPEITQSLTRADESPIWLKSVEIFSKDKPDDYKLMIEQLCDIKKIKDLDTWDTWLSGQHLDKATMDTKYKWLRKCKAYMPPLAAVKGLALGLSNLDPHKVAPLITMGVFVLVELTFGLMDPATRDKAMELLLKTNVLINKWASRETDLRRMKMVSEDWMLEVNQKVEQIEKGLSKLYFDSLVLISLIYGAGRSRGSRFAASFVSAPAEWERAYKAIQTRDSEYGELKSQVDSMLKNCETNIATLDWIWNRKEDPEPLHETVKERTGVDDTTSTGGRWFLETVEFSSWVDDIRGSRGVKRVFWLKGPMGTGKTTLLCRTVSHFDQYPIDGVKFVPYYCHGSGASPGPRYETILRALCRRLAWNSDGSVAETAMQLYQSSKLIPDAQVTAKKTWEPLLQGLIASSRTTIVFVLDALEECKSLDHYTMLLKFLKHLPWEQNGPFFLVSSQPHVPVEAYFGGSVQLFDVVRPETRSEMRNFINAQIDSIRMETRWENSIFFKDIAMLEDLKSSLLDSAGGMYVIHLIPSPDLKDSSPYWHARRFRWVEIWLGVFFPRNSNAVRRKANATSLLNRLKELRTLTDIPHDEMDDSKDDKKLAIKGAYEKLWSINGDDGKDTDLQVRLFQIITASFENLRPQALHEAVCFDPSNPDHYEELESDHIEGLYSSFLKVNKQGFLEYEHISAKMFVEEISVSDQDTFSSKESHRTMAEMAFHAIEQPLHRIWIDAGMDLIGLGVIARASVQGEKLTESDWVMAKTAMPRPMDDLHFGQYLFRFWLRHCQTFHDESQFIERMSNLFQSATPAVEFWINYHAGSSRLIGVVPWDLETMLYCHNTLTRLCDEDGGALRPSPFLCMVSFGFSPISHHNDHPVLLPGFGDTTIRNSEQGTALHVACDASNPTVVEDLLKLEYSTKGTCCDILTMKDDSGRIPLHSARSDDVVRILLHYEIRGCPVSPTINGLKSSRLLHWEDKKGEIPIADIWVTCSEALVRWILHEYLVKPKGLDYLYRNALTEEKIELVKILLEKGADPNVKYFTEISALSFAVLRDNIPFATLLLEHGASLDDCGEVENALSLAVKNGNLDMLDLLYSRGLDVDAKRPQGTTALCVAVSEQRINVIEHLLRRGADVCAAQGPFRQSALQFAACNGNTKIAGLLLDNGADINAAGRIEEHETPKGMQILSLMSDASTAITFFRSPLALAATTGNREMAEFLMSKGADVKLLSTKDKTALDTLLKK